MGPGSRIRASSSSGSGRNPSGPGETGRGGERCAEQPAADRRCGFNPKSYLWERERHRLTPSPAAREAGCLRRASISPGAGGRRAVTPHPSGLGSGTPSGGGRAGGHGARGRVSAHTCGHANALSSPTRPTRVLLSASFTDWEMRRRSGLPKCRARTLSQTSWLQGPC